MSKKTWMHFVISLALGVSLALTASLGGSNAIAQNVTSGEWSASLVDDQSRINLNFFLNGDTDSRHNKHQFGQSYDFAELGLTREQVMKGGPITFTLAREAGTIACEGSFENGKG